METTAFRSKTIRAAGITAAAAAGMALVFGASHLVASRYQDSVRRATATADLLRAIREVETRRTTGSGPKYSCAALVVDALRRGADPNAHYGNSPSTIAATYRYVARRLPGGLPGGEDTTLEYKDRWPVVLMAAEESDPAAMRALIAAGADVKAHGDGGETALYLASSGNAVESVQMLLDMGADPNEKSGIELHTEEIATNGSYPLEQSMTSPAITRALLTHGADPRRMSHGMPLVALQRKIWGMIESHEKTHPRILTPRQRARQVTVAAAVDRCLSLMESANTRS